MLSGRRSADPGAVPHVLPVQDHVVPRDRADVLQQRHVDLLALLSWIPAVHEATEPRLIPIDGQTLRGSSDRSDGRAAIHMVSAWATEKEVAPSTLHSFIRSRRLESKKRRQA